MTEFKYLGMTLTNHNCKRKRLWGMCTESRLLFGEGVLPSGAKVLDSYLLYKSMEVKLYKRVQLCNCVCHMKGRMVENGC